MGSRFLAIHKETHILLTMKLQFVCLALVATVTMGAKVDDLLAEGQIALGKAQVQAKALNGLARKNGINFNQKKIQSELKKLLRKYAGQGQTLLAARKAQAERQIPNVLGAADNKGDEAARAFNSKKADTVAAAQDLWRLNSGKSLGKLRNQAKNRINALQNKAPREFQQLINAIKKPLIAFGDKQSRKHSRKTIAQLAKQGKLAAEAQVRANQGKGQQLARQYAQIAKNAFAKNCEEVLGGARCRQAFNAAVAAAKSDKAEQAKAFAAHQFGKLDLSA